MSITQKQLKNCDIFLMIPGRIDKTFCDLQKVHQLASIYIENMENVIKSEYNNKFIQNIKRICLGELDLLITTDDETIVQKAYATVAIHNETRICVLEIAASPVSIGGNKLLLYYCGELLLYRINGKHYSLNELLSYYHIKPFGEKRSIVFSDNTVTDQEIINALANEENPMGKISGIFAQKLKHENHAQYDTAEVYVSTVTMFEKCKTWNTDIEQRTAEHTLEIFFVELLLFQDAAIDKLYKDIQQEEECQRFGIDISMSRSRFDKLSFDLSQALRFSNYNHFYYPTVRQSAKTVAEAFGIEQINSKYETNRKVLQEMIEINSKREQKEQDKIKNRFLFFLTSLSVIGAINGALNNIAVSSIKDYSYFVSIAVAAVAYTIYKLVILIKRKRKQKYGKNK